jgi:hypothetical protein
VGYSLKDARCTAHAVAPARWTKVVQLDSRPRGGLPAHQFSADGMVCTTTASVV